jgi:hypothetical protein
MLRRGNIAAVKDEHIPDFDGCWQCKDAVTIVLPTGEMYRVCAPSKWKSYECAGKQLIASKKLVSHVDLAQPAKPLQQRR